MKNTVKTGGLSAATVLAAGTGAYGAIVAITPPANVPNAAGPASNPAVGVIAWDVTGDGTNDFGLQFRNPQSTGTTGVVWQANLSAFTSGGTAAVLGFQGAFIPYGANILNGTNIGPTTPVGLSWRNQAQVTLGSIYRSGGIPTPYGGFAAGSSVPSGTISAGRGFLGIRFTVGGATRFGWLDVEVRPATSAAGSGGIFFFGGAYEDSGAAIQAGAVPTPGAVSAMALGAAGLLRRSRRQA